MPLGPNREVQCPSASSSYALRASWPIFISALPLAAYTPWSRWRYSSCLYEGHLHKGTAMPASQIKLQKECVMAGLYLGVAVSGVNALVATGLIILTRFLIFV